MPTPTINSIISQLSELTGKTSAEKDTMVAGGNVLLEVVKQSTPHTTTTTILHFHREATTSRTIRIGFT